MSFALLTNNILTDSNITGVLVGDGTNAPVGVQGTAGQFLRRNIANNAYEFVTGYTAAEIDSMIQGLDPKASVRVATTANITLSGTQTIDGVAVVAGDRVLVKDQTTQSQNGIYIVAAGAWTRSSDMDLASEFSGAYMFVEQGTVNADRAYVCTSDNVTVGTTAINFVLFAGSGAYEPSITAGTTAQYWRGDKTWQTLNTSVIPELTNLYYTDARARAAISLTTTGSSGAATYSAGVFNIPNYTLAGLGGFSSTGSFFIGTTSIAINRASAAQTLTGVSIDGSAVLMSASGGMTTQYGDGRTGYANAIPSSQTGIFPTTNNANSVLTINTHPGNYHAQLGFSPNGNIYYRYFNNVAINTTLAWQTVWTNTNDGSGSGLDADLLDGLQPSTSNVINTIVQRDSSGNFAANAITLGSIQAAGVISVLNGGAAQGIKIGNLVVSNSYSNNAPTNGIYVTGQIQSAVATGTAPFIIASTTRVTNLNVATAGTADALTTARLINGVSFNGTQDIIVPTIYNSTFSRITNPGGGEFVSSTAVQTGAIVITLPRGMSGAMVRFTIKIYEYATNESFEVNVGGYPYSVGNTWANQPFAYILGNPGVDRRFNVRFGYNSTLDKAVVYIGETTSTWAYPQIFITDVQRGFADQTSLWANGWTVGFEPTAFQNVTATISNSQIGYALSTNTASTTVLRDASGNFSAGTITAALSGNATTATTWQTARTITIGPTGKSVNGSANVSWSLAEIGVAGVYLPLSGGTLTGALNGTTISTSGNISVVNGSGGSIVLWAQYSGSPAHPGIAVTNNAGTLTFSHNSNGGTTLTTGSMTAASFIRNGGTSAQFLKADGSVDTNTYATTSSLGAYLPLAGGTMSGKINMLSTGADAYGGAIEIRERGYVLAVQSDWSFSPAITFHWANRYAKRFGMRSDGLFAVDDEPLALRSWVTSQGYTGNTGTVTSVGGAGTVSGLTLSGSVTTSGNLTLGGTLTLTAAQVNAVGAITNNTSGNAATVTNGVYTTTFNTLGDTRYLRLIGGTLTGQLDGTTAQFRGDGAGGDTISYSPLGVTRAVNTGNNMAYFGMTKTATLVWAMGIGSTNEFIVGNPAATTQVITTPHLTLNTSGVLSVTSGFTANKASSDSVLAGPFISVRQPSDAKQWVMQLNSSNGLDFWVYNGTSWIGTPIRFLVNGGVTIPASTASTSTTTGALVVTGGVGIGGALNVGSTIVASSNITAYSDVTLKENIYTVDNALEKTMKLRGVYYNRKDDSLKTKKLGVVAQEIREVLPEVVLDNDGLLSVDYGNIVGVLIEAIKELKQEVEQLKQK